MIKDLAELKKLLQLCRKQGVTEIELGDVKIKLGDLPTENDSQQVMPEDIQSDNPYANFPQGILTPEQLMFYSAGGTPDEDPVNKAAQ